MIEDCFLGFQIHRREEMSRIVIDDFNSVETVAAMCYCLGRISSGLKRDI